MSGQAALSGWTLQSTSQLVEEIDEEFDFHLDCRVRELIDAGWEPEPARAAAEREFGERAHWRGECRKARLGPSRWLLPILGAALIIPATATIIWLSVALQQAQIRGARAEEELRLQQERVHQLLAAANLPDGEATQLLAADDARLDLSGTVLDQDGKPVPKANIVVIHKSWPNNRYRQDSLRTTTGDDGTFRLPKLYVPKTQVAFLVTVLAEGHTMVSEYVLRKADQEVAPFKFTLRPAVTKTLIIKDNAGQPVADTAVFPTTRRTQAAGEEHHIYYQSATDCGFKTDAQGRVRMSVFAADDEIDLGVMTKPESTEVTLKIDAAAEQTITISRGK
jgi:hypothetical protein